MLWCDQPKNIGDDKKAPCGSSNVKIIVESKYSVVYHCSDCRRNSIIVKDVKNARN